MFIFLSCSTLQQKQSSKLKSTELAKGFFLEVDAIGVQELWLTYSHGYLTFQKKCYSTIMQNQNNDDFT